MADPVSLSKMMNEHPDVIFICDEFMRVKGKDFWRKDANFVLLPQNPFLGPSI